ncbi:MAG: GNAT family N-acetyltransferase [Solobacterium sp.]|nr:GNAT family N-acetyltransferase [Solobacterium sp.]
MIKRAEASMDAKIKECWKKCFTMEDPRYIEYFFRNIYKPEYMYVDDEDSEIAAALCVVPHAVMFNGRVLHASMISGVCTAPDYRNQGRMHRLIETAVDACSHRELITLAPASEEELLRGYGFEPLYYRSDYTLSRDEVKRITNYGCAYEPSPIDMLKVYSSFIRRFNGYYARDLEYFVNFKKEVNARGGKIVAYYDSKNQIQGYASILIAGREAVMEECVYLGSVALNKLINAALQERPLVHLQVSSAEGLSRLFPDAVRKDYAGVMVRLNDAELFSRLFSQKVESLRDLAEISQRPLTMRERY